MEYRVTTSDPVEQDASESHFADRAHLLEELPNMQAVVCGVEDALAVDADSPVSGWRLQLIGEYEEVTIEAGECVR